MGAINDQIQSRLITNAKKKRQRTHNCGTNKSPQQITTTGVSPCLIHLF